VGVTGLEHPHETPEIARGSVARGAENGALDARAALIARWDELPERVREAITRILENEQ
jgi:hypothetical protein